MLVYVVDAEEGSGWVVHAVFDSEEKAKAYCEKHTEVCLAYTTWDTETGECLG